MALLDTLKDKQDNKYISFWGLVAHIIDVDEQRDDDTYFSNETYRTVAEALLRLELNKKVRYLIYDSDNFYFEQIDEPETDEAYLFLRELFPRCGKRLTLTEMTNLQRQYKNYFWLKESITQILPDGAVNFTDPRFFGSGEQILSSDIKPFPFSFEASSELRRLQRRVNELEAAQSSDSFMMETPTVEHGEPKTNTQLINELGAANGKIKQQEQNIDKLNQQLSKQDNTNDHLSDRSEKGYQTTIGLLLELMTLPRIEGDRPPFTSEAVIIGRITDKSIYGQGRTTLETRFRDAKITLEQTKKKTIKSQ